MKRSYEVVIIGAGPAGSLAARQLARLGHSVLLVDRATFPRWKVCGCCLNGHALSALDRAGLQKLIPQLGAIQLHSARLSTRGRSATVSLPSGMALSRQAFDMALIEAAIVAGVEFRQQTIAKVLSGTASHCRIALSNHEPIAEVESAVVIAADGLQSQFTSDERIVATDARIGAGTILEEAPAWFTIGTIYMGCGRGGYVGLVRLEDHRLDIAAAFDPAFVRECGSLPNAAMNIANQTDWPTLPHIALATWRGTPALTRTSTILGGQRWLAIGDAAGYIEPFTGEGMAWALGSALAVAPLASRGVTMWLPSIVDEWNLTHQRWIGKRQWLCRGLARGLRSQWVTNLAIRLLKPMPRLASPLVRALNAPIPGGLSA